jgi:pimeloyl-ACP methyl ester carboxylesterase
MTDDNAAYQLVEGSSDRLIIAFNARVSKRFGFYKILAERPETKLFVRDTSNQWYNAGCGELGADVTSITEALKRLIEPLGPREIVTLGSSMGGYAAILFGALLGAKRAITFAPQTWIDPMFALSPPAATVRQVADLTATVEATPATAVDIIVGPDSLVDLYQAVRLAHLPSVTIYEVAGHAHGILSGMQQDGTLGECLSELIDTGVWSAQEAHQRSAEDIGTIEDIVISSHRSDHVGAAEASDAMCRKYPTWAGIHFFRGDALKKSGRAEDAASCFEQSITANVAWSEPHHRLGVISADAGRVAHAEECLRRAISLQPGWARPHLDLAALLLDSGRVDAGQAELAETFQLDPRLELEAARRGLITA